MITQDLQNMPRRPMGGANPYREIFDMRGYRRGDVHRFQRWHASNTLTGNVIYGRWRQWTATNVPVLSVVDGCLVLSVTPIATADRGAAAVTLLAGDVDVVLELSVQVPRAFPSNSADTFAAGVMLADGTGNTLGVGIYAQQVAELATFGAAFTAARLVSFLPNIKNTNLPTQPEINFDTYYMTSATQPFLVRLKRLGTAVQVFMSQNGGVTWNYVTPNTPVVFDLNALKLMIFGWMGMDTPAGVFKVLCSGMKFLDPRLPMVV